MAKKKSDKMDTLSHFNKRFNEMDAERSNWIQERETCDAQYEAEVYEDNMGKVNINNPLEQDLVEMETGRTAGRPVFDVIPDPYDPNPEQVDTAKYILDSFLDREGFIEEYRNRRIDKGTYGTGVFYAGLRYEINDVIERNDEDIEEEVGNGFFSKKNLYENAKEEWYMTPMNVPLRQFWADDGAFYQPNFKKAKDCIMLETLSKEEFIQRYGDNKHIDKKVMEEASPIQEDDPAYGIPTTRGQICIYHYFNRVTKEYSIIVNKTAVLFEGKMIYKHGKLPFVMCQHYPNNRCLYGFGICRKVRVSKAYLNNITQSLMDGARMTASKVVSMGNSGELVDGDVQAIPGGITMARFTNALTDVGNIDTQVNLNGLVAARGIVNEMVRTDTGIDMNAPFEAPAEQLGTVEIIEQNKAIRYKTPDEARDHALDAVFEMTLSNIEQFAPTLLKRTIKVKGEDGKVISEITKRPTIQIKNVTIKKKKGTTVIEEDYGSYGHLELKPDTLNGDMTVRVVTPNTHNQVLKIIEKNRAKELVTNYAELAQIFGPDKLQELFPFEEVIEKLKVSYGYDKQMTPISKKKATIMKNEKLLRDVQELLSGNGGNVGQNQGAMPQGGGMGEQIPAEATVMGQGQGTIVPQRGATGMQEGVESIETTGGAI